MDGRIRNRAIAHLRKVPIFQRCSRRQVLAVARIGRVTQVPAGRTVVRVGAPGNEFYMILEGTARVEVLSRRRLRLGRGNFFGEMSLLDGQPRSATVVAETPLQLLVIRRPDFWTLLREVPELTRTILVTLSRRVRQAEQPAVEALLDTLRQLA